MSKRKQTEKLHLYTYDNARGLPTFLQDWSDNARAIDAESERVQGEIDALDTRLTTAEETIESLSPESILDYKVRLDALERKSNAQANLIESITREQVVQNNLINKNKSDIETLRLNIDTNTSLINELREDVNANRADITTLSGRVDALEARVATLEHEVVDLTNDIIGLGENVRDIATQLEAVTVILNEKQDKLTAGAGIRIVDNVISATGSGGGVIGSYDSTTENLTLG